ncbi:phosphotransferase family protein [Streptomyces sp. NPDC088350]|uniref:phosphotransferase family protein n=1 Tax=Streptomyces sp. NPDC088350 TaxID=3365854 RepID=UPI00382D4B69
MHSRTGQAVSGEELSAAVSRAFGQATAVLGRDFLVTSALRGTSWHRARRQPTSPVRRRLRHELGQLVAGLHRIHGPTFGYPQPETGLHGTRRAEVITPTLVHFDLWEGNFVLDTGAAGPRIEGLIDAERAFGGDPHADFVSLALFDDIEKDAALVAGYRVAGGQVDFTPRLCRRLTLYQAYLYLIMIVEAVPRGYAGPRHLVTQRFCRHKLKDAPRNLALATEADR